MSEKRIVVWVQEFQDRKNLVLQWHCPRTGARKSKSAGTSDPKQAEIQRQELETDLNRGHYREPSRMPWDDFRKAFEAEYVAPLRPCTRKQHRVTLSLFEELCGPARLEQITARTVSTFAAKLRTRKGRRSPDGMMPSTIRVRLEFLHTALSWAVRQGMLVRLPEFPAVKVPRKRPQPVSAEAFERLLAKADQQTQAYLLCGWLAGLRRNEAFALEWEETAEAPYLDPDHDRIVFPAEFVKADEDQWVPLDPQLREALYALPRQGKKVFRFTQPNGDPVVSHTMTGRIQRLASRAGVKLTMRSLRRGFGCRYAGKVPAQVLQRLMRHANISTTTQFYCNTDDAVMAAVVGPKDPGTDSCRNSGRDIERKKVKNAEKI